MSETTEQTLLQGAVARARAARDRRVTVPIDTLGLALSCRIPADGAEIERLGKQASRIEKGAVRGTHMNRAVVAALTEEILIQDVLVTDVNGDPLTFRDPELWRQLGEDIQSSKDAVVALLSTDGIIANVAARLLEEGGYIDQEESDPI